MLCSSEINDWLAWWLLKASVPRVLCIIYVYKIISWGQPLTFCNDQLRVNFSQPLPFFPSLNVKSSAGEGKGRIQLYFIIKFNCQHTFKFLKPKCSKYRVKNKLSRKHTLKFSPLGSFYIKGFWTLMARIPKQE